MASRPILLALVCLLLAGPSRAQETRTQGWLAPKPPELNDLESRLLSFFRGTPIRKDPDPGFRPGQEWVDLIAVIRALRLQPGDFRDIALVVEVNRRFSRLRLASPRAGLYPSEVERMAIHVLVQVATEELFEHLEDSAFIQRRARSLAEIRGRVGQNPALPSTMDFIPRLDGPPPGPPGSGLLGTD